MANTITKVRINGVEKNIGGSTVVANPTLVGDEPDLTGLEVEGTKYKVPEGGGSDLGPQYLPVKEVGDALNSFNNETGDTYIDSSALYNLLVAKNVDLSKTIINGDEFFIILQGSVLSPAGSFQASTFWGSMKIILHTSTNSIMYTVTDIFEDSAYDGGDTTELSPGSSTLGDFFQYLANNNINLKITNTATGYGCFSGTSENYKQSPTFGNIYMCTFNPLEETSDDATFITTSEFSSLKRAIIGYK